MTLHQFRLLPENEQAEATWQGKIFLSREDRDHTVIVYKVHDFYVEVYYHRQHNQITRFNPFTSKTRLLLYFGAHLN